ncbi:hypothetical protein EON63_15045 [archaeon]|nr:MAG: hypothetical protein EON63_15045 [archaeon]
MTFSMPLGTACQMKANIVIIEFTQLFGALAPLVAVPNTEMKRNGESSIYCITGMLQISIILSIPYNMHHTICIIFHTPKKPHFIHTAGGFIDINADGSTSWRDAQGRAFRSRKGTKENDVCSNRGICDYNTGNGVDELPYTIHLPYTPYSNSYTLFPAYTYTYSNIHKHDLFIVVLFLGICSCYNTNGDVYGSSDGYGGPGNRGDCG